MKKLTPRFVAQIFLDLTEGLPPAEQSRIADALVTLLAERGERKVLRMLPLSIEREFFRRHNTIPVTVTMPTDNDASQVHALVTALEVALGKRVEIREQADASLMGGARVAVADERWDFSLRAALQEASKHLSASSIS